MNNLTNWIYYNNSDRLAHNIEAISAFPNNDNAQIKANNFGTLGRADGAIWGVNYLATKAGLETELSGTVKAIEETFKSVEETFSNDLKQRELTLPSIEKLKDDFVTELNLLEGLQNIQAVYQKRYQNTAEKVDALTDLNSLAANYRQTIAKHETVFTNLVDQYKQQLKSDLGASVILSDSLIEPRSNASFSLKECQSRLDAYLGKWSPNVSSSEANKYINQGRELLSQILRGEITDPANKAMGSEQALTSLMWFLMHCALEKQQGHSEGSFALEDNEGRLYNFLTRAAGCGDRESSHYYGRSKAWTGVSKLIMKSSWHKGIDVTNGKLPAEKRHILFGQVDPFKKDGNDKLVFIKLENFSPFKTTGYGYDAALHGVELVNAQYNKICLPGSDDKPEMAKERVPSNVLNEFTKIVKLFGDALPPVTDQLAKKGFTEDPIKAAKTYGIAYMKLFVKEAAKQGKHLEGYNPREFARALPQLDHMKKRTGREVYLSREELARI